MTDVTTELLTKFNQFCRAGKNARLSLECRDGQVWAYLHVQLPRHHAAPAQHHRRPGPSRLRRRARRAAARKNAAEEVAENSDNIREVVTQADNIQSADAAAQAPTADVSPLFILDRDQPADEEAAGHVVQQQHIEPQIPEEGVTLAKDVFCPDNEYQTAVQAEHARDRDVLLRTQPHHRHHQPQQQEREKLATGITLEDFQRLVKENSRKLHF